MLLNNTLYFFFSNHIESLEMVELPMSKWNRQIRTGIHLLTIRGKINMSDIKRSSTLVSKWFNEKWNASLHCQMMELVLLNGK